jgi:hypothetical protein
MLRLISCPEDASYLYLSMMAAKALAMMFSSGDT